MTLQQCNDHKKYLKKPDGKRNHNTAAQLFWLQCMVFYNNLHRFTCVICVVGLFPKLYDSVADKYCGSLKTFREALQGGTKAKKQAKAILKHITSKDVLDTKRRDIGIYIRKIHMQEFLQEKTLLLPLLVLNWVMFTQNIDGRDAVWPLGYIVRIPPKKTVIQKRLIKCLKVDPDDQDEQPVEPEGYRSLCPGLCKGDTTHDFPLFFEFLPYVVVQSNIQNLGRDDDVYEKRTQFIKEDLIGVPLVDVMEAPIESAPTPSPKKTQDIKTPNTKTPNMTTLSHTSNTKQTRSKEKKIQKKVYLGEKERDIFKKLHAVTIPGDPKDWVNPNAIWEWTGAETASNEQKVHKLLSDMRERRMYLAANKLKVELRNPRQFIKMDQDHYNCLYKDKIMELAKIKFGQLEGTEKDIEVRYKEAIEKYGIGEQFIDGLPAWTYEDFGGDIPVMSETVKQKLAPTPALQTIPPVDENKYVLGQYHNKCGRIELKKEMKRSLAEPVNKKFKYNFAKCQHTQFKGDVQKQLEMWMERLIRLVVTQHVIAQRMNHDIIHNNATCAVSLMEVNSRKFKCALHGMREDFGLLADILDPLDRRNRNRDNEVFEQIKVSEEIKNLPKPKSSTEEVVQAMIECGLERVSIYEVSDLYKGMMWSGALTASCIKNTDFGPTVLCFRSEEDRLYDIRTYYMDNKDKGEFQQMYTNTKWTNLTNHLQNFKRGGWKVSLDQHFNHKDKLMFMVWESMYDHVVGTHNKMQKEFMDNEAQEEFSSEMKHDAYQTDSSEDRGAKEKAAQQTTDDGKIIATFLPPPPGEEDDASAGTPEASSEYEEEIDENNKGTKKRDLGTSIQSRKSKRTRK